MMAVDASPEVAHEHDLRVGHRLIASEAAGYRLWLEHRRGADPLEATDVANECSHERLTGDPCPSPDGVWPHSHPCACWGERNGRLPSRTPDLIATLKTKEPVVETTTTPPAQGAEKPEAPFGYKADGVTPRKRAAPSAQQLAAASAGRARAAEARKAAQAAPLAIAGTSAVAGTSTTPSIAVVQSPLIARLVAELDAEIAQLNDARNRLLGVE